MCKMVVIACNKSKYAHTNIYAQWIASEFGANFIECSTVSAESLLDYDIIVYGGGIYNNSIEGISTITDNFNSIKDKTIVVFTVGAECSTNGALITPFAENTFSKEMKDKIHIFHLKGESDYIKNGFTYKNLWHSFKKFIVSSCPKYTDSNEQIILSSYGNVIDFIDKHTLDTFNA